jgi:hypothetical protein
MDENTTLKTGLFAILLVGFIAVCLSINKRDNQAIQTTKVDSLNQVIDSLQTEIFYLEDGFDHKEHIYEQAIYDCEHRKNHKETLQRLKINE